MIALIDLDPLPYAYGGICFDDGRLLPDHLLIRSMDDKIAEIVERSGSDDWLGYLTDSASNFRIGLATIQTYKGNREGSEKPPKFQMLRDYLLDTYKDKVTLVTGMEADDAVSIAQCNNLKLSSTLPGDHPLFHGTIICSIDKDLNMVPGWHYCWSKGDVKEKEPWFQTEIGGLRCFYKQCLTGDSTDNILGLHGVGPKSTLLSALDDMETEEEMFLHVYHQYQKRFGNYADLFLLETGRLLWMLKKAGEMWEFPINPKENKEECYQSF